MNSLFACTVVKKVIDGKLTQKKVREAIDAGREAIIKDMFVPVQRDKASREQHHMGSCENISALKYTHVSFEIDHPSK